MPRRFVLFVLLLIGLTACGGADVAPGAGAEELALVNDADLDAAAVVGEEALRTLDLRSLALQNVPEPERERVFERFHRLSGQKATGSGLGLSIVRRVADVHGAQVAIEAGKGDRGTKVLVRFISEGKQSELRGNFLV